MKLKNGTNEYDVDVLGRDAISVRVEMPWTDGKSRMIQGHYFKGLADDMTFTLRRSGRWVPKGDPDDGRRALQLTEVNYCGICGNTVEPIEMTREGWCVHCNEDAQYDEWG
jgi:hypothetical protein